MRELFELGVKPEHDIIQKGLGYIESIYKKHMVSWISGLFEEPLSRAGNNRLVLDWYTEYLEKNQSFRYPC